MKGNRFFKIREKFTKYFLILQDLSRKLGVIVAGLCNIVIVLCGFLFATLLIARLGFYNHQIVQDNLVSLLRNILFITYCAKIFVTYIARNPDGTIQIVNRKGWARWIDISATLLATIVLLANTNVVWFESLNDTFLSGFVAISFVLLLIFVSEFYKVSKVLMLAKLSPPMFFAVSFLILIFVGSGLLMLPDVHIGEISYFEALFTATSTICVSGLSIVDLPATFTLKGDCLLLVLFQIGGLGVMVFTGLFAFAFTGTVSFKDRLMLKDMFSSDTMSDVFVFLAKVISITFLFELIGAVAIYFSIADSQIKYPIFFSIFHSVSAFCNCGISTLPDGFANPLVEGNNLLLLSVAILTTLGGIGFPVLISLYTTVNYNTRRLLHLSTRRQSIIRNSMKSNMATQIALITTISILIVGTLSYYALELKNTLANSDVASQWIKSFFCCATARTAGFNVTDVSNWGNATMILIMAIMWIGASPGSTGGGIKTTTFALALCSIVSFVRGNRYIEIGYHRIGLETILRVLAFIFISLIVIFSAFMLFTIFEPTQRPFHLFFDTVSVYSTTGLSLIGTTELSMPSRVLTMILMFVGRVGPLTLLSGMFVSRKPKYAKYPYINLTIN